jgi:hypothetical protein
MDGDRPKNSIREIVQLVKSGKMDRADALSELKGLLQSSARESAGAAGYSPEEGQEVYSSGYVNLGGEQEADSASGSAIQFSQEDRRDLIQKLIQKKKLQKSMSPKHHSVSPSARDDNNAPINGFGEDDELMETPYWEEDSRSYSMGDKMAGRGRLMARDNDATGATEDAVYGDQPRTGPRPLRRSSSAGSQSRRSLASHNSGYDANRYAAYPGGTMDDSIIGDARAYRIAQTEAAIRSEMFKECTFKPRVRPLPKDVYPELDASKINMIPFYERVTEWQKSKEGKMHDKKSSYEEAKGQELTFKPRMNRNSERAVQELRGPGVAAKDVHERLYKHYELALTERSHFINEEVMRARMELDKECTFQPKIGSRTSRFADIEPRYDRPTTAMKLKQKKPISDDHPYQSMDPYAYVAPEAILGQTKEMKECTFTPKVKGVGNSMSSAKLYVSSNVVDRLTRPSSGSARGDESIAGDENFDITYGGDRNIIDINSFMCTLGGAMGIPGLPGAHQRQSYPPDSRSRDGFSEASAPAMTPEENRARQKAFSSFMGRLEQMEARKVRHAEEMRQSSTPTFKPALCRRSLNMSERSFNGNFLERVERNTIKREDQLQRRDMSFNGEKDATFRPELTRRSERMRARTSFEMSKGDLLRKEASKKMLEARLTEETKKDMTFKPKITKKAREEAHSFLKLGEDTSYHLDRHQETLMRQKLVREYESQRREEAETEGCTFAPVLKDCPSYIKRIARSVATIKSSKGEKARQMGAKAKSAEERRIEREQNWNASSKVQE